MDLRILIIDDVHPFLLEKLEADGISCDYRPGIKRAEVLSILAAYQGLVVRTSTLIDRELLQSASSLVFVARAGSGMDNVDEVAAAEMGIQVFNAAEANADAVGEHALGMLLCLMHKLLWADREVRNRIWHREANRGTELKGKTVALIGYGHTGMAFGRKLSGLEMNILAYDKYRLHYSDRAAREASMDEVFEQADIISFHIPLNAETFELVNADYIGKFRKPVVLLNLSRGKVVKLHDLVHALKEGHVKAAGLDVLENEELDQLSPDEEERFSWLAQSPQVMLTPHIGGWTRESYEKISRYLYNKISLLAKGLSTQDLKQKTRT